MSRYAINAPSPMLTLTLLLSASTLGLILTGANSGCSNAESCHANPQHVDNDSEVDREFKKAFGKIVKDVIENAIANIVNEEFDRMLKESGITDPAEIRILQKLDLYVPENITQGIITLYFLGNESAITEKGRGQWKPLWWSSRKSDGLQLHIIRLTDQMESRYVVISIAGINKSGEWITKSTLLRRSSKDGITVWREEKWKRRIQ